MTPENRIEAESVHQAVASLLDPHFDPDDIAQTLRLVGPIPNLYARHKLTVSAASAIGAYAVAVEQWWRLAKAQRQTISIEWTQALCALNPGHFQKQSGYSLPALSLLSELKADFYRTADEKWFFPIGSYPHLRDGVLELLQCANTPKALGHAIGQWQADDLEETFAANKLPGAYARSKAEWLKHPQGALLALRPVIEIEKIADSAPEPSRSDQRPLDGINVLDLSHVIAGPIVARSLAEHGANVLRLSAPLQPDPFRQIVDTNIGKRSAFIDLNCKQDLARLRALASNADVFIQSWKPGSFDRKGLDPLTLAHIRPGIIYVSVSAYGDSGPWGERGGFEQLGQVVSGIAVDEGSAGKPRLAPTYLLNDYLTGYLGASGVVQALIRRAREGGSYHVKVSLTRTSMWVQSLGLNGTLDERLKDSHFADNLKPMLETRNSPFGVLEQLPPVAQFSITEAYWDLPPYPLGAHRAQW